MGEATGRASTAHWLYSGPHLKGYGVMFSVNTSTGIHSDKSQSFYKNDYSLEIVRGGIAQLVERSLSMRKVWRSNRHSSTFFWLHLCFAQVSIKHKNLPSNVSH